MKEELPTMFFQRWWEQGDVLISLKDGSVRYEKHKIFLYREDFEKFAEGFSEAIGYIKKHQGDTEGAVDGHGEEEKSTTYSSDVKFEDLAE